jgi:hypothetical protein
VYFFRLSDLVGSSFLALWSVLVFLLFLVAFVAIESSISYTLQLRPEKVFGRQIALIANSRGCPTSILNSTAPSPGMVLMIAGLNGANYWPTSNEPTLKCQVASFKVDR